MSVFKAASGRWRAQVYDPATRKNVSVSSILGPDYTSFRTKTEAKQARSDARKLLNTPRSGVTVGEFHQRWTTDKLFERPKQSTNQHNRERTRAFADAHSTIPIRDIGDQVVGDWLAGGQRTGQVPALRAMFNDAMSVKAGRVVDRNPWAGLGISRGPGNADKQPPPEEQIWSLIRHARDLSGPYFAAWLQVAAFTGMRPGELDALRWDRVDLKTGRIRVIEQVSAKSGALTSPKNGRARDALLTPPAREALLSLPRQAEHCFVTLRGTHFTASARAYHWKAVRAAAGWTGSLYLATRHFAGWYMVNVLELASEDVAIALGHTDGGELVRRLYGHRDRDFALARVLAAYESTGNVRPLRLARKDTA